MHRQTTNSLPVSPSAQRLWRPVSLPADGREALAQELGVSPTVAGLLIARGCADAATAHRFLHPSLDDLHDPFLLPDIDAAVTRIARALETGEKILVHGDYDVDGVCAAALMTRVLRALGANVEPFVPHRREDGYDLRVATVRKKKEEGVSLIITVDCGIVAHEAAECARELGMDLIVTDHHRPDKTLPPALAVVNPHRHDSAYPFKSLAGVGVAFKVATALVRKLQVPEQSFRTKFLDLVALGTTVDCMPLVDENRVFVKFGLDVLRKTGKPGLRALMAVAGVEPGRLDARSLGFALGPRINAVGRLDAAEYALKLLLTGDETEALQLAQRLDRCNLERQEAQNRILQEALEQARGPARKDDRVLVLAAPDWHSGVIGIVASKIVDIIGRPAIMIALDGERGRGSARSIEDFHIFDAIDSCRSLLERCGGHAQAAGFDTRAEHVEEFRQMLGARAAEQLTDEALQPRIKVDAFLDPTEVNLRLAHELRRLEPFGHGNPEPVFVTRGMPLVAADVWQPKTGTIPHLSLRCRLTPRSAVHAIFWRNGEKAEELRGVQQIDLCYQLEIDEYRGAADVRLIVKDLRLPADELH
jgi:single-stranded-DNA-specific exonuclease